VILVSNRRPIGFGYGSAVVVRLHHALADGIALSQVLLSLTDATRTGDLRDRAPADPVRSRAESYAG
jgi:diacylglycerol O-acyltransferase